MTVRHAEPEPARSWRAWLQMANLLLARCGGRQAFSGTVFEGSYQLREGELIPSITGTAFITAESRLILSPGDPFLAGIRV